MRSLIAAVAAGIFGLFAAAPAFADITFDEFVPTPGMEGSWTLGCCQHPVDGVVLDTSGTIFNVDAGGGSTNAFLQAGSIAISGAPYGTPECCLVRLQSFDVRASKLADVGQTVLIYAVQYGYEFRRDIVLTSEFQTISFDFDDPIGGAGMLFYNGPRGRAFDIDNIVVESAVGVPEPATWALMILGFGAVGGVLRRRAFAAA